MASADDDPRTAYPAIDRAFADGWDDPKMDDYDRPEPGRHGVSTVVDGVVRDTGRPYADGTTALEIHVPIERADGLPFQLGVRVPIQLRVGSMEYRAGLRSTSDCKVVWFSPDIYTADGTRHTLGRILTDAGFRANDVVRLEVNDAVIVVRRAG